MAGIALVIAIVAVRCDSSVARADSPEGLSLVPPGQVGMRSEHLQRVEFEYRVPVGVNDEQRASLSWRLTEQEKEDIIKSTSHPYNRASLAHLVNLLKDQ